MCFVVFICRHSSSSGLTFKNLCGQLEDFANCSKESKEIVEQIKLRIGDEIDLIPTRALLFKAGY